MCEPTTVAEPFSYDPIVYINGVKAENLGFGRYEIKLTIQSKLQ